MCQVEIIFIRKMGAGMGPARRGRELCGKDLSVKMTLKQRLEERKGQRCRYRGGVCRPRKRQQQKLVKTVTGVFKTGGSHGRSEEARGDEIREVEGALLGLYCLKT